MDQDSIDRIRSATFPVARRGYEKREVDRFLTKLADWLESGGSDQTRSDLVKRELERVGEKTASILATAEDSAEELRAEAEQEAEKAMSAARKQAADSRKAADEYSSRTRKEADRYAERTRRDADRDAQQTRSDADQHARETVSAAEAKSRRIVDDGTQRRSDIEAVISDLVRRRDSVLAEVDRLVGQLRDTVSTHTPAAGADPFETPSELDPQERAEAATAGQGDAARASGEARAAERTARQRAASR